MIHNSERNIPIIAVIIVLWLISGVLKAADATFLGAGDVIKITVYGQSDMTTTTRIGESNNISFPLIGDVIIGGLSTAGAENKIARLLSTKGFVKNAQVNIFVEQRLQTLTNTVTILGKVVQPGKYSLQSTTVEGVETLIDLIAAAGGTNEFAAEHVVLIKKQGDGQKKIRVDLFKILDEGSLDQSDFRLSGGDIVFVPEMDVFFIYGQVQRPGRYRLERGMTVMQALSVGGGITERGSERGIQIKRRLKEKTAIIGAKPDDELVKDDVVYVKESLF
ncbi:MAG: SLBB domain-containing protein [Candidatus Thiodiazotropha sp. (ex Ustalcina ferruginea)]|nr:SLBB domain-containing protein [Candidatus Thiodiazotropha sp. (ex Ustalcina ferruginea)]